MARFDSVRRRDIPQIEVAQVAAAAAGSAADAAVATIVCALPDPSEFYNPLSVNEGVQGDLAPNRMAIRHAAYVNNAANRAGVITNNYDWNLNLYRIINGLTVRAGTLFFYTMSVATTITPAITASTAQQTVAVASATGIVPGLALYVDSAGSPELVKVLAVSGSNITAVFTKSHSGGVTLTSEMLLNRPVVFVPASAVSGVTSATTISAGSQAVTPNTVNGLSGMYGIHVGDYLYLTGGTGAAETVQVTAVTATTFTATFANGHSGAYTITTTVAGGPTGTSLSPQLMSGMNWPFEIIPGDVIKLERVSTNVTGLASDAGVCQIDWIPSKLMPR